MPEPFSAVMWAAESARLRPATVSERRIGCARPAESKESKLAERTALITGASSGIGLAIARTLGEEGYALTVSARRPEKLEGAADSLRSDGLEVQSVAADMSNEEDVVRIFSQHRERYGRLDVLVNNAGVGIGAPMEDIKTKYLDMQLAVNLRALVIGTREGLPMLREAAAEHGKALIVNTASIAGKGGQAWLSVYAATKAAVINFTQSTHREVGGAGIQCTALAPGFVDTPMTDFAKGQVPAEQMIQPEDLGEAVRFLLRTSPNCHVPEIVFTRPSEGLDTP
jgi:NAD(P)-dependent dehydrogenase (short-subunit alcohol dehydrogenase family)